jgi:hypothetical protein
MDWLSILCGLFLIGSGVLRIFLTQSGKLPVRTGISQYFPYAFVVLGALILILGFAG